MAIKPRTKTHIKGSHCNDIPSHSRKDAAHTEGNTRDYRSLIRKKRSTANTTTTQPSKDSVDAQEIQEMVAIMREKGIVVYHIKCKERSNIAHDELVSLWRQMLVKWMFYVVDCCKLQRHAVAVAAYFLDVAMLRELCKTREEHQLAAATALQMALKTYDTAVIRLDRLVKLGRGLFTEEDVAVMEMKIVSSLNWYLHPPTLYCFLNQYERLAPSEDAFRTVLHKVLRILAEEMTLDEIYIRFCPSVQALAAMKVALDFVPAEFLSRHERKDFESQLSKIAKTDERELSKAIKKIYKTLKTREKFQAIIDATSATTKGALMYQRALETRNDKQDQQHSPRDVKAKLGTR